MTHHRSTRLRNAFIAMAGIGLAVAAPASAYAGAAPSARAIATPTVPLCQTRHLAGRLGEGSGAAGSTVYKLHLRNTGSFACRVGGFPGVSYVTAPHGHQVGASATESGSPDGWVTLAPGKGSPALLQEVDPLNFPSGKCHLTDVAGLRVYPPNRTTWLFVRQSGQACANKSLTQLSIQAFTP